MTSQPPLMRLSCQEQDSIKVRECEEASAAEWENITSKGCGSGLEVSLGYLMCYNIYRTSVRELGFRTTLFVTCSSNGRFLIVLSYLMLRI